jgi:hypothetical protein
MRPRGDVDLLFLYPYGGVEHWNDNITFVLIVLKFSGNYNYIKIILRSYILIDIAIIRASENMCCKKTLYI